MSLFNRRPKETPDGGDRQAAEDPRDPGSLAPGGIVASSGSSPFSYSGAGLTLGLNAFYVSYPSQRRSTPKAEPKPATPLERVQSEIPILAHRIAYLRFDGTERWWKPLHNGTPFGVDQEARCTRADGFFSIQWSALYGSAYPPAEPKAKHAAPAVDCTCGFYALPSDVTPWDEGQQYVTLMVELSGTVIEHEKGYRAGHQRVVECQIPACTYCHRVADRVLVQDGIMASAACEAHVPKNHPEGLVVMTAVDLSECLPVPVTFLGRPQPAGF